LSSKPLIEQLESSGRRGGMMIAPLLIFVVLLILKGFSSLSDWTFTISQIIAIPLGLVLGLSALVDILVNIPKTLSSSVHPYRDPNAEDPGETYRRSWAQQKRRYAGFIGVSLLVRGVAIFLLIHWFYYT
jgi:hypothetical protein